ncbi:MAG: hypothetical protein HOW71_10060 [Nonomuraea sp.]|nr:hypothetical protein [Nonomuraea sp.]
MSIWQRAWEGVLGLLALLGLVLVLTTSGDLLAVLLGGTSPYGRHAGVAGTVLGVLILAAAQGRLAYHGAPVWVFMLVMGAVMMIGLGASKLIDALRSGELSPGPS